MTPSFAPPWRGVVQLVAAALSWGAVACANGTDPAATGEAPYAGSTDGSAGAGASAGHGSGSEGGALEAGGGAPGSGGSGGGGASAGHGPSSGCATAGMAPGDHETTITFGGIARAYLLHVPAGYDHGQPAPLVLNFHGFGSYPADQAAFSNMSALADDEGFVVAYPAGIGNSWNAGVCCGAAATWLLDDVGFARAVVADIEGKLCIDDRRVYATGMSNGGYLSHRLGCEAADVFAAIAPVAGVLGIPAAACQPSRAVPVLHFHGTADSVIPYLGGLLGPSAAAAIGGWAARNGCIGSPVGTFANGAAHCESYESCDDGAEVTLCTLEGEGHCWPGQVSCPFGASSTDIDANAEMWTFFSQFSLP